MSVRPEPGVQTIVVAADCAAHPAQVHAIRAGAARRLERFNDEALARVAVGETREVTVRGARRDKVQALDASTYGVGVKIMN